MTTDIELTLVPVEVFGADDCCEHGRTTVNENCPSTGYGLCDAVTSWSDCNRAYGKIYRVDDLGGREPGESVKIRVAAEDAAWFEKRWGDVADGHEPPPNRTRLQVTDEVLGELLGELVAAVRLDEDTRCGVCGTLGDHNARLGAVLGIECPCPQGTRTESGGVG